MSENCTNSYLAISQVVPWFLVVIGWWLVNNQNNWRETRKEVRNNLNDIKTDLRTLEANAIGYHCAEAADEILARNIKASIQRIGTSIRHLSLTTEDNYSELLKLLRQSITRHNFDTSAHEAKNINGELVLDITLQIDRIVDFLENAFTTKYQK